MIRTIKNDGFQIEAFILRHGLSNEKAAYDVEAGVLDAFALLDPVDGGPTNPYFGLKNLVKRLFLIQSACKRSARPPEWMSDRKM
ncbi:hypothetical protein GCM10009624_28220 [Gordonia sinesedis]